MNPGWFHLVTAFIYKFQTNLTGNNCPNFNKNKHHKYAQRNH